MAGIIVTARHEATERHEGSYVLGFNPPISREEVWPLVGRRSCDLTLDSDGNVQEFKIQADKFDGVVGPDSFMELVEEVAEKTGRSIYNEGAPVVLLPGELAVQAVMMGNFVPEEEPVI